MRGRNDQNVNRRSFSFPSSVIAMFAIVLSLGIGSFASQFFITPNTYENCIVGNVQLVHNANSGINERRVITSCGEFTLSLILGATKKTDNHIESGETYNFEVTGITVPFIGKFPIIHKAHKVS